MKETPDVWPVEICASSQSLDLCEKSVLFHPRLEKGLESPLELSWPPAVGNSTLPGCGPSSSPAQRGPGCRIWRKQLVNSNMNVQLLLKTPSNLHYLLFPETQMTTQHPRPRASVQLGSQPPLPRSKGFVGTSGGWVPETRFLKRTALWCGLRLERRPQSAVKATGLAPGIYTERLEGGNRGL